MPCCQPAITPLNGNVAVCPESHEDSTKVPELQAINV